MNLKSLTVLSLLVPTFASASQFLINYTGVVTNSSGASIMPVVGAPVQGSVLFDSDENNYAVIAEPPGYPNYAAYEIFGPPYYSSIQAPPRNALSTQLDVEILDNDLSLLGISGSGDIVAFSTKRNGFSYSILLQGPETSFSGTSIPSSNIISSFFVSAFLIGRDDIVTGSNFRASIATVTISAVPEVSTAALFACGAMVLANVIRPRQSR
jgi:hypothetical protein